MILFETDFKQEEGGCWRCMVCQSQISQPSRPEQCKFCKGLDNKKVAVKYDGEKPRWDLLPYDALEGVAKVLSFGAQKYAENNWRHGMEWTRLIRAGIGHLVSFLRGEDVDRESGLSHLDHAACCVLFLSAYVKGNIGTDNRWKAGK